METLILIVIFLVACFVRLLNSGSFMTLTSEIAQHYLEIIRLLEGQALLSGPLTSHIWLRLSATPYYLFFPIFWILRFDPMTLNYVSILANILTVPLNYIVVRKIFDRKTAILSSLFLALSPMDLVFARAPGFFSLVIPLTYLLIIQVFEALKNRGANLWVIFLIVGIMSTLHAASYMLMPFFVMLMIFVVKPSTKKYLTGIIAFLIPNVPFILIDAQRGFSMLKSLMIWVPYKFWNFLTGKTLGLNRDAVSDNTIAIVADFFKGSVFPLQFPTALGLGLMAFILLFFLSRRRTLFEKVLFYWLAFGVVVLLIHKNPPVHYFVPIFCLPIILLTRAIVSVFKKNGRPLLAVIVLTVLVINVLFVFSGKFGFYDPKVSREFIPYANQLEAAKIIANDADGKDYMIQRIGPFDTYKNQFRENYEFLLWWLGNRPVNYSKSTYLIVEGETKNNKIGRFKKIGVSGKISVYRNQ